ACGEPGRDRSSRTGIRAGGRAHAGARRARGELRPRELPARREVASLGLYSGARGVRMRLYRAGEETVSTVGYDEMRGVPVSGETEVGKVGRGTVVSVRLGPWPSGLYFAELTAPGRVGYAPFVLRPARLGTERVAHGMPAR